MEQLAPGERFRAFEFEEGGERWRVAAPICYEGTFPRVCRAMVMEEGRKTVDLLANISNDGWFVYKWMGEGSYQGSTEHSQHLVQYLLQGRRESSASCACGEHRH